MYLGLSIASLFFSFILICSSGLAILRAFNKDKLNLSGLITLPICIGIALNILVIHLISYLTGSFAKSLIPVLALNLISIFFISKKSHFKIEKIHRSEIGLLVFAFFCSICSFIKNQTQGIGDAQHLAYSSNIAFNDFYPPRLIVDQDVVFDFYHSGADLIIAAMRLVAPSIDAFTHNGLLLALAVFLLPLLVFEIVWRFTQNKTYAFLSTFIIFCFMSINSVEFFIREFGNFFTGDIFSYIRSWIWSSHISSDCFSNNTSSMPVSWGIAYAFAVLLLIFMIQDAQVKTNLAFYFSALLLIFVSNFTFSAYLLPILAALGIVAAAQFFTIVLQQGFLSSLVKPLLILTGLSPLAILLSFTTSQSKINGLEAMIFNPHTTWTIGFMRYLSYFYDNDYLKGLSASFEERVGEFKLEIPIFSSVSFREFGFLILLALVVLCLVLFLKRKNFTWAHSLLILASLICFLPISLFTFVIAPIELTRFLFPAKIYAMLFIAVGIYILFAKHRFKLWQRAFVAIAILSLSISLIPGIIYFIPNEKITITGYSFNSEEKDLVALLTKIHKSGDVLLHYDPKLRPWAHDLPYIAGFHSPGGMMLKPDFVTYRTAIYLLNPRLLKELAVDYVLIQKSDSISNQGKQRLLDPQLFRELPEVAEQCSHDYRLFKFIANEALAMNYPADEYIWIGGYTDAKRKFTKLSKYMPKLSFFASSKQEAQILINKHRDSIARENKILAIYTSPKAVLGRLTE